MAHHNPEPPLVVFSSAWFRALASTGIVLAVLGFSVAMTTLYRYPFDTEFRLKGIIWLLAGTAFLFAGRLLRVYGGFSLVVLLLLLDAWIWGFAEFSQRSLDWWR